MAQSLFYKLHSRFQMFISSKKLEISFFRFSGELSACDSNSPNVDEESSSDDDEYWFENADPKRPQIQAQVLKTVQAGHQRRIFHKLAPQVSFKAIRTKLLCLLSKSKCITMKLCYNDLDYGYNGQIWTHFGSQMTRLVHKPSRLQRTDFCGSIDFVLSKFCCK